MTPPKPLRIGVLLSSAGLLRGGLETAALGFAQALSMRGHRVTLLTGRWPGRNVGNEAKSAVQTRRVLCVPSDLPLWQPMARRNSGKPLRFQSLFFYWRCIASPRVRRLLRRFDVTLTFLEPETVRFAAWRARRGLPNVSYFPGGITWGDLARDQSIKRVAVSETVAEKYRDQFDFRIDGVVTAGIDDRWFEGAPGNRRPGATLVFVGRLESGKGVELLIDVVKGLQERRPNLELRLIGDGPLRRSLMTRCAALEIESSVSLLGRLAPDEVRRELANADLFVFPSVYESFGFAVLEAMAAGLPVICSDLPALRETTGNHAVFLPPTATDQWVDGIHQMLDDQPRRETLASDARQHAVRFSWGSAAEAMEPFLYAAATAVSAITS